MSSTLRLSTGNPPSGGTPTSPDRNPLATPHPDAVVYLIQAPTIPKHAQGRVIDTSPLLWWGKHTRTLMEKTQIASFRPAPSYVQIRQRLKDFRPDIDYVVVAGGDSLAVILVGAVLAQYGHDHFNYLRFERARLPDGSRDMTSGHYNAVRVPLTVEEAENTRT